MGQPKAVEETSDVARRVAHFAARAGLSKQVDLAARCKVSEAAVSKWLSGENDPSYENLGVFCEVCQITRSEFWGPLSDDSAAAS